jgi:hypothetical protein
MAAAIITVPLVMASHWNPNGNQFARNPSEINKHISSYVDNKTLMSLLLTEKNAPKQFGLEKKGNIHIPLREARQRLLNFLTTIADTNSETVSSGVDVDKDKMSAFGYVLADSTRDRLLEKARQMSVFLDRAGVSEYCDAYDLDGEPYDVVAAGMASCTLIEVPANVPDKARVLAGIRVLHVLAHACAVTRRISKNSPAAQKGAFILRRFTLAPELLLDYFMLLVQWKETCFGM